MSKTISDKLLDEAKDQFSFFDTDGDGKINQKEFIKLFRILVPGSTDQEALRGFQSVDRNHDGHIDQKEFEKWWQLNWYCY